MHVSDSLLDAVALVGVGGDEHAVSEHLADLTRPRGVILGRVDADLDLIGRHAGTLLACGVPQVAFEIAATNHAQERDAAALLNAEQSMRRLVRGPADKI